MYGKTGFSKSRTDGWTAGDYYGDQFEDYYGDQAGDYYYGDAAWRLLWGSA